MGPRQVYRLPSVCAEVAAFASSGGQQCAISPDCRRGRSAGPRVLTLTSPLPHPSSYRDTDWCPAKICAKVWAAGDQVGSHKEGASVSSHENRAASTPLLVNKELELTCLAETHGVPSLALGDTPVPPRRAPFCTCLCPGARAPPGLPLSAGAQMAQEA